MISAATAVAQAVCTLNAESAGNLDFWTEAQLYEWADEAAQRLGRTAAAFGHVQDITVLAGTSQYGLEARAVSVLHAALGAARLRAATVADLEALDPDWQTRTGTPTRYTLIDESTIRLYPEPIAGGTLHVLMVRTPDPLAAATPDLAAVKTVTGYLKHAILAGARGVETDGRMPDVAAHCRERVALYLTAFAKLWGPAA